MALGAADTGSRGGPRGQRPLRAGQGSSARRCHLPTGVSEGAAGIVAALPTCRPVAFNCSLSVTGVLREVVVCPVTSRLAPQHLDSVVTWRTLRFLCPGARPLGAFCPRARVHCAFPSLPHRERAGSGPGGAVVLAAGVAADLNGCWPVPFCSGIRAGPCTCSGQGSGGLVLWDEMRASFPPEPPSPQPHGF